MRPRAMWLLAAGTAALAFGTVLSARTPALELGPLLDRYEAGRFDEALATIDKAGDDAAVELRSEWMFAGRLWIDADPSTRARRLLVAATFALEAENQRVERGGWLPTRNEGCSGACVLNWARGLLLERGEPDEAERTWLLTAIALGHGVRDARFLAQPLSPNQPMGPGRGMTNDALARFPGDPRFRLDRAIALAARFSVTTEGAARTVATSNPSGTVLPGQMQIVITGRGNMPEVPSRDGGRAALIGELKDLGSDPVVGTEALIRLGYLRWTGGEDAEADAAWNAAAHQATSADLKYLANFLLGWTALLRGDDKQAVPALTSALEARPDSQSATVALASLEFRAGAAEQAYTRAQASLTAKPLDDDPWRLFLYGHHPQLPSLIKQLRQQVSR